jgi:uroporphyrinogen decarboxylase
MDERERWLANVELRGNGAVPCTVIARDAEDWHAIASAGGVPKHFVDAWDCTWLSLHSGLRGEVKAPALADIGRIKSYRPPDQLAVDEYGNRRDWQRIEQQVREQRKCGRVAWGAGGRFYDRVHFLRGFENFMIDVAEDSDALATIIEMVLRENMRLVRRWIDIGVDVVAFNDDLGMQDRLQISPGAFRRLFLPGYSQLFSAARAAGVHVQMHTNGRIVPIMRYLVEAGATVLSVEDLVNDIGAMQRELCGRICIQLNVDRRVTLPFGSPEQVDSHIRGCIEALGSPRGGLLLVCRLSPGTPPGNIASLRSAIAKYQRLWCGPP